MLDFIVTCSSSQPPCTYMYMATQQHVIIWIETVLKLFILFPCDFWLKLKVWKVRFLYITLHVFWGKLKTDLAWLLLQRRIKHFNTEIPVTINTYWGTTTIKVVRYSESSTKSFFLHRSPIFLVNKLPLKQHRTRSSLKSCHIHLIDQTD